LSELGYNNVPEQKLNTFVSDLKRLIRYEEKRRDLDKKLDILDTSVKQYPDSRKKRYQHNIFCEFLFNIYHNHKDELF
jgi:hypothetical protein